MQIAKVFERSQNQYTVSTDPRRLDFAVIHRYLAEESYWSAGIPLAVLTRALENSLCFGLYAPAGEQVGFARVISDYATFAYLADVFILEHQRGKGLGKWLVRNVMQHPRLQGLRNWMLLTRDAHGLYARYGFAAPRDPSWVMLISHPDIYDQD